MSCCEIALKEKIENAGNVEKVEWMGRPEPKIYCKRNRFTSRFWFMCLFILLAMFSVAIVCTDIYTSISEFVGMIAVTTVICGNAIFWFVSTMYQMAHLESVSDSTVYTLTDKGVHYFGFRQGSPSTFIPYNQITSVETTENFNDERHGDIIIKSASAEIHMCALEDYERVTGMIMSHM